MNEPHPEAATLPQASVILPAYYSARTIELCLEALRAQTFRDFETIVVNSSPGDGTRDIVTGRFPEVIFDESPQRLLPHAALNRGVLRARGELLVFTSPDCVSAPTWLELLVQACRARHPVVQGGAALWDDGWLEQGMHLCKRFSMLCGLPAGPVPSIASANACYRREVWQAAGPFDGDLFCGDTLLSWRAKRIGYALWLEPRAVVREIHGQRLVAFCRERFTRGAEFGRARARFEQWSRQRAAVQLAALPLLPALLLARTARASLKSGWLARFLITLPVQIAGHATWLLGEAVAQARQILGHEA